MSAERVIANLLRIAREDLEGARLLNTRGNRNAIYLCEQAAEKLMRAVLTSEKIHAGVRHQLVEMVNLVPEENPIKPRLRELQQSRHVRDVVPIHHADGANSGRPAGAGCRADRQQHRGHPARGRWTVRCGPRRDRQAGGEYLADSLIRPARRGAHRTSPCMQMPTSRACRSPGPMTRWAMMGGAARWRGFAWGC